MQENTRAIDIKYFYIECKFFINFTVCFLVAPKESLKYAKANKKFGYNSRYLIHLKSLQYFLNECKIKVYKNLNSKGFTFLM